MRIWNGIVSKNVDLVRSQSGVDLRRILKKVHLYIALTVGFMFTFSGLTGSALVFYKAIDEFLNPALLIVEAEAGIEYAPLSDIIAAAQQEACAA